MIYARESAVCAEVYQNIDSDRRRNGNRRRNIPIHFEIENQILKEIGVSARWIGRRVGFAL